MARIVPRVQIAAYTCRMNTQMISTAAIACASTAKRFVSIAVRLAKYWSQMTIPVTISKRIRPVIAQKMNFCPALYLPSSGNLSSWPASRSLMRDSQMKSVRLNRLARQSCEKNTKKLTNRMRPIHGWIVRVV